MVVTFIFQAEDGIRDGHVTGVQTCALPILSAIAEVPDADSNDAVTRAALTERLGLQIERADQHLDIAMVNNLASTLQIRDVLDQMPSATADEDRKSTRLNSSHVAISYAVFCLKINNRSMVIFLKVYYIIT